MSLSHQLSQDLRRKRCIKGGKHFLRPWCSSTHDKKLSTNRKFSTVATVLRFCKDHTKSTTGKRKSWKNPRVITQALQKTLQTAKVHVYTIRNKLNMDGGNGRTPRSKPLLSINKSTSSLPKTTCFFYSTSRKCSVDKGDKSCTFLPKSSTVCLEEKKRHCAPTPHPKSEAWCRGHYGLALLCCLRTRMPCNRWENNEFKTVSRQFTGECQGNRPWPQA